MLSVLLATHNGSDTIERTLAAMAELEAPAGGWKLVVVNNASTDDTESRVLKWRDRLPMDYVVEPRLGKSFALNSGLARAEGDFIVMTDDDVLPDRDWLVQWRRMADAYPQCAVFGAAIVPEFDGHPPTWPLPEWCMGTLYGQSSPWPEGEMSVVRASGANMGLRMSAYEAGWRFNAAFMVGGLGLMGEDTDLATRMVEAGEKLGFAPAARVRHIIHRRQLAWSWIWRRFERHARGMFLIEEVRFDAATGRALFDTPWWKLRRAMETALRLPAALLRWDRERLFEYWVSIIYDLGSLRQALTLRLAEGRKPAAGAAAVELAAEDA